jgi:kynurenine 3-monooxygenase
VLYEMLGDQNDSWEGLLPRFSRQRVPDGNAILDLALYNYIEMRDLTANPSFLLQKKIEAKFHERYPDLWLPLYSQVTFSHIRYSEALRNGQEQDRIMQEIMALPDIEKRWNDEEVMEKLHNLVTSNKALQA